MTDTRGPKERTYDEYIAPLMARIIETCKEHRINMAAQFVLDRNEDDELMKCSTCPPVDDEDEEGKAHILELRRVMYPRPMAMAFTIGGFK